MRWLRALGGSLALVVGLMVGMAGWASAEGPQVSVSAPANGALVTGDTVTVSFRVTGLTIVPTSVPVSEAGKHPEVNKPGEGHVHFMLDLQPLVVWTSTDPYTFKDLPPGEHQLMVELVQNDHSPLSPPVVQQVRFTTSPRGLPNAGTVEQPSWRGEGDLPWLLLGALALLVSGLALRRRCR